MWINKYCIWSVLNQFSLSLSCVGSVQSILNIYVEEYFESAKMKPVWEIQFWKSLKIENVSRNKQGSGAKYREGCFQIQKPITFGKLPAHKFGKFDRFCIALYINRTSTSVHNTAPKFTNNRRFLVHSCFMWKWNWSKIYRKRQDRKTVYVYSNCFDPINLFETLGN